MVEIGRKYLNVLSLLKSGELTGAGLGKNVKKSMEGDYSINRNEEIWEGEFSGFLYDYIFKRSTNVKILQESGEAFR